MRQASGEARHFNSPILARVTIESRSLFRRRGYALVGERAAQKGYAAYLSEAPLPSGCVGVGRLPPRFLREELKDSDLVLIAPDGLVSVVWETGSAQNGLLLTEACDCRCLMCPQPPQKHDPGLLATARQILARLHPTEVHSLCLTGGEPALLKDELVELLAHVRKKFPKTPVSILTNAKGFVDFGFAKSCAAASAGQVRYCVSLHADNDLDHDRIVGVPGSFQKTVHGITNLARLRVPIEIRFVINRANAHRMASFADFVYRNFPFAIHVAFMAMEISGLAEDNIDEIWVDPADFGEALRFAATRLAMRGVAVSIYNMPLCLLPQEGRELARRSISGWKNDFLPQCEGCFERPDCAGIFTSSSRQSAHIHPITVPNS